MKKKILSLVLVVAMLASMLVFAPVSGATETAVTVSTTDAVGVVGQTVSVDVVLSSNTPLFGIQLGYEYDSTMLRLDSVTWGIADGSGDYSNKLNSDFNCAQGPLDVMIQTYASTFDAADGLVIATLNFTALKEGSSKVAIRDFNDTMGDSVNYAYTSQNYDVYFTGSEIACAEASTVTVFPAGYTDVSGAVSDGFSFSNTLTADKVEPAPVDVFADTGASMVIVPETAQNKRRVDTEITGLDAFIFVATQFSTLVVPEHVKTIAFGAINDPAVAELTIFVLGNDTVFEEQAVLLENVECKVTICGASGSTAEAYALAEGYDFVAVSTLTVDGASYLVPAETTVPDVVETNDGKVVVGWTVGEKNYAPGAAITLTGDTTLTPVTINAIQMNTGVGFKMGASIKECKMRYTTDMAIADYDTLAELGTVTLGTIITPAKYVSMAGGLTKEALTQLAIDNAAKLGALPDGKTGAGLTYIDVPASAANPFGKTTDTYTFAGSLAGFKNENVNTKNVVYAAAFYATVTIDEETSFTVYSAFDLSANRTVNSAITAMTGVSAAEYGLTTLQAQTLKDLIAGN